MQHATWTDGPSLPTDKPEAITRGYDMLAWSFNHHRDTARNLTRVKLLMKNVANPRKPFITNPARIHFISEIPEPAAYFAKDRTRWAAVNENMA